MSTIPGPDPAIRVDEPTAGHPAAPAVGSGNLIRTLGLAGLVALIWAGLAWHSQTTTYHLAPLLVVLTPSWIAGGSSAGSARPFAPVLISAAVATVTAGLLATAGLLSGATVTGGSSATVEAILLIGAALVWSLIRTQVRVRRSVNS